MYNYMVGPVFDEKGKPVGHRWIVEFQQGCMQPSGCSHGESVGCTQLQAVNGDYAAKRTADLALKPLVLQVVPCGTFDAWLDNAIALGGQHKVPRLTDDGPS